MYHINKNIENLERVFDQNTCREKQITLLVGEASLFLSKDLYKIRTKKQKSFYNKSIF